MNANMKQHKIYIDIEEEITNVVEHLRRARADHIVLVVPQHALLLQSVVNLKLLVQEAKKLRKNIVIMTKDPDGAVFAQRAGILTQPYVADEEDVYHRDLVIASEYKQKNTPQNEQKKQYISQRNNSVSPVKSTQQEQYTKQFTRPSSHHVSGIKQSMYNAQRGALWHDTPQGHSSVPDVEHRDQDFSQYEESLEQARVSRMSQNTQSQSHPQTQQRTVGTKIPPTQQKESFSRPIMYQRSPHVELNKNKKQNKKVSHVSDGAHYALKSFVFFGIMLVVSVLLIAVLPKTRVSITPKKMHIDENMEITAQTDQSVYDEDRRLIPARLIERDITFTKTFSATGSGDVDAQKAQGTIIIYNEYDEDPQPLVATTRFLAEDGTLFRLVKQTIIPGMKDGEPGKVEALVIADAEGSGGNIGPTRFSVPGFDGSPKKDKFYGVSERAMAGGGSGGSGVALVTQDDIDNAEKTMNNELSAYVEEQIKGMLRPDSEVLLTGAMKSEVLRSEASMSEGTMGENFMFEIVSHVKALVFVQGDVSALIESRVNEKMQQYDVDQMELTLTYDVSESDFENELLKMKVHGTADVESVVDGEAFKKDIQGKKHNDLLSIIESEYSNEIEKITIESVTPGAPGFIADRISRFSFMTDISIAE